MKKTALNVPNMLSIIRVLLVPAFVVALLAMRNVEIWGLIVPAVIFVITSLISILSYVGYVYFSVTMANTRILSKHPKLFGVLVFLAVHFITDKLAELTMKFAPLSLVIGEEKIFFTFKEVWELDTVIVNSYDVNVYIIEAVTAVILLFATSYFIENKINIK